MTDYLACLDCGIVVDQCDCQERHRPMPRRINWQRLIGLLRKTYRYGGGGLSEASGIAGNVLTAACKDRVHNHDNAVTLWNLAVERLSTEQINSCVIHGPKALEW